MTHATASTRDPRRDGPSRIRTRRTLMTRDLARRARSLLAAALGCLVAVVLAGCASVTPYGVADHDAKMSYHAESVGGMLTDTVFVTLMGTEEFSAVGYTHAVASSGESLHVQHDTSVLGATWWSRESTADEGTTIDRVHFGGRSTTHYLFGDAYLPVSKTPWVSFPEGDIPRDDPGAACLYPAVWYLCGIAKAWQATYDAHAASLPVLVERNADGTTHLASAVTLRAIVDANLFGIDEKLASSISDETFDTFLPLHVWFDDRGLVTKAEVNGAFGENPKLELQLGFELSGTPSAEDRPGDPANLDPKFVTNMTNQAEIDKFWQAIGAIRHGG